MLKYLLFFTASIYSVHTIAKEDDLFKTETKIKVNQFGDEYLNKELPINNGLLKSNNSIIKISNNLTYKLDLEKMEVKLFKDVDKINKLKFLIPYDVENNLYSVKRYAFVVCPIIESKNTISYGKAENFELDGSRVSSRILNFDTVNTRVIDSGYYILSGKPNEKVMMAKLLNGKISILNNNPVTFEFMSLCEKIEIGLLQNKLQEQRNKLQEQIKNSEMKKLGIKE